MQSQLVCAGCRTVLLYPRGASSVRCAICSTITALPVAGSGMAQLVCAGCRTLLMYTCGASSVRCSCCNTINVARQGNAAPASSIECGHCRTLLMYPSGAPTVKCAVCHYVTTVGMNTVQMHLPPYRTNSSMPSPQPSSSTSSSGSVNQTVVVENPMSVDESGKLVSNVVVGVTTGKK